MSTVLNQDSSEGRPLEITTSETVELFLELLAECERRDRTRCIFTIRKKCKFSVQTDHRWRLIFSVDSPRGEMMFYRTFERVTPVNYQTLEETVVCRLRYDDGDNAIKIVNDSTLEKTVILTDRREIITVGNDRLYIVREQEIAITTTEISNILAAMLHEIGGESGSRDPDSDELDQEEWVNDFHITLNVSADCSLNIEVVSPDNVGMLHKSWPRGKWPDEQKLRAYVERYLREPDGGVPVHVIRDQGIDRRRYALPRKPPATPNL